MRMFAHMRPQIVSPVAYQRGASGGNVTAASVDAATPERPIRDAAPWQPSGDQLAAATRSRRHTRRLCLSPEAGSPVVTVSKNSRRRPPITSRFVEPLLFFPFSTQMLLKGRADRTEPIALTLNLRDQKLFRTPTWVRLPTPLETPKLDPVPRPVFNRIP